MAESFNATVPYPRAMSRFPVIRQSWLSQFDDCALATRFEFEYRGGWSTHYQARGQMFHRFAGRALREMATHNEPQLEVDVALAIFHEVLRQDDVDRQCPWCFSENVLAGMSRKGLRTCGDCDRKFETEMVNLPMREVKDLYWTIKKWAYDNVWDTRSLYSVEERLKATIRYGSYGGVERILTGQTDALFRPTPDHVIVIDWKDMWALPGPTDLSFKGYFQQRFYAWLIMKQPEFKLVEKVTLREFYVRYSEPREATIFREDLDDIEAELGALAERFDKAYETNAWTPSAGKHCSFCLRPSKCPIPVFAREDGRIIDGARARQVAESLLVAEKVVKDNRNALKAYADVNGNLEVKSKKGPRVLGFRESVAQQRPTREALEKALFEAGPGGTPNMDELFKTRKQTRFGIFTPVEEEDPSVAEAHLVEQLEASIEQAKQKRATLEDFGDEPPF